MLDLKLRLNLQVNSNTENPKMFSNICKDYVKIQLDMNPDKSNFLLQLSHMLYCNNVICMDEKNLNKKICFLTSTIQILKKRRNELRHKKQKSSLNTKYHLSLIINKVLWTFDLWYNILKFNSWKHKNF